MQHVTTRIALLIIALIGLAACSPAGSAQPSNAAPPSDPALSEPGRAAFLIAYANW